MFFIVFFTLSNGQVDKEKTINRIEQEIKGNRILKLEDLKEDQSPIYEKTTIYLNEKTPILIIKESNSIINARNANGTRSSTITNTSAKFYITNWEKNGYIRVGEIKHEFKKYDNTVNGKTKTSQIPMPEDYTFSFDKKEVETVINNHNF